MNGKMKSFTGKALAIAAGMVVLALVQSNPTQAAPLQVGVTVYDTADPTNFYSRVIVDGGAGDLDPAANSILLGNNFQPIPGYFVQGSYHTAHFGEPNILTSASSSVTNTRGTTTRAFVVVSDMDFQPPANAAFVTGSGTWTNAAGSTIALGYYNDPTNGQYAAPFVPFLDALGNPNPAPVLFADFGSFDPASLLFGDLVASFSDTATSDHDSFGFNGGPYGVSNANPFAMSLMFDFSVVPNGMLTSRGQSMEADPIPEPSTFLLLGAGLGGVVWLRRRK